MKMFWFPHSLVNRNHFGWFFLFIRSTRRKAFYWEPNETIKNIFWLSDWLEILPWLSVQHNKKKIGTQRDIKMRSRRGNWWKNNCNCKMVISMQMIDDCCWLSIELQVAFLFGCCICCFIYFSYSSSQQTKNQIVQSWSNSWANVWAKVSTKDRDEERNWREEGKQPICMKVMRNDFSNVCVGTRIIYT